MIRKQAVFPNAHRGGFRERKRTFALFVLPGFALYTFFFMAPIIMGIYYSLTNWNGISRKYSFIGVENYISVISNKRFIYSLLFNARYSLLLIVGIVVISVILALLLNRKVKGLSFFRSTYFLPVVLSQITIGLIFNQIYLRILPAIGVKMGISVLSTNILANQNLAVYAVLFVNLWQGVCIPTILFLAGLQTIPEDLYESASLDGAGSWKKFSHITVPYLLPTLSIVLVMALKSGLMVFDYIKSLTDGGPGGVTESLSLLIYNTGFVENKYSYSIAMAIVVGLIICAISSVQISATNRKGV